MLVFVNGGTGVEAGATPTNSDDADTGVQQIATSAITSSIHLIFSVVTII
jgi:hypothetical protein